MLNMREIALLNFESLFLHYNFSLKIVIISEIHLSITFGRDVVYVYM